MSKGGPGWKTPMDAFKNGPREKLIYVTLVQPNTKDISNHGDYLGTIDVDPESATYCQVIHRTFTHSSGNEVHLSSWNTCSSCYVDGQCEKKCEKRNKLILPCVLSSRIFVIDTTKERAPEMHKILESDEFFDQKTKDGPCHTPHTAHCLPNGNIMISTQGKFDESDGDDGRGQFVLLDSKFEVIGTWAKTNARYGYDFWYQPYFNVMVASELGSPGIARRGLVLEDLDHYSQRLNFYNWSDRSLFQTIDLGPEGLVTVATRFFHNPKRAEGFVCCALFSNIFRFFKKENENVWCAEKVIDIPPIKISGWKNAPPASLKVGTPISDFKNQIVQGTPTCIIISLDDRFLYVNNYLHGDVRQYDMTDSKNPRLVGQIFLGGILANDDDNSITCDDPSMVRPKPVYMNGRRLYGGPQGLQVSLDGKRLYVGSSLFSIWDKQFYPKMVETGGWIVQLDIDTENGGLTLNDKFFVDFGKEPYGPTLPHEMRFPGGDCTSDIWLAED